MTNTVDYLQHILSECKLSIHNGFEYRSSIPAVTCKDGYKVSIQAGEMLYSIPKENRGPWSHVELGYPTEEDDRLDEYVEDPDRPLDTVYGYVPIELVAQILDDHGGVDFDRRGWSS